MRASMMFTAAFAVVLSACASSSTARPAMMAHAGESGMRKMENPCPLHLTNLGLSPAQDSAYAAIRAEHMKEVKAARDDAAKHAHHTDSAAKAARHDAMKESMERAVARVGAILTPDQRATFDAALEAHRKEKGEREAAGMHDCEKCCAGMEGGARHEH